MKLREGVLEEASSVGVCHVWPETIDSINILNASILAMHKAIAKLSMVPEYILVDGNRFKPYGKILYKTMIKGDGRFLSIAAASILAKTERDLLMEKLHLDHPHYDWINNKGYPTRKHREALKVYGSTKYHRQSFKLLPLQLKLEL